MASRPKAFQYVLRSTLISAMILMVAGLTFAKSSLAGENRASENVAKDRVPDIVEASPNIVLILCDDLGYGDVRCMAPETCQIATPGIDRIADQGMIFTDAHSGSSVCTPTRYGLLTGRYSWRTRLQSGVAVGFKPCLIAENRPTVGAFLQSQGYHSALVGKWHLDFQYLNPDTKVAYQKSNNKLPPLAAMIPDGPLDRGFDFYHGFHHAREMEAVVENRTVIEHDETVNMLPRLINQSVSYIDGRKDSKQPFFLYVPFGSPHTPIVPTKEWKGRSGMGDYADFVMQTDDGVAQILDSIERNGFESNTLVIFSSDNGCSKAADIAALAKHDHPVSGPLRGSKADLWDGGHRVPFVAKWPGRIQAKTKNDQLICLVDFFATIADVLGETVPNGSCEDSVSFLAALEGEPVVTKRTGIVHHSVSGHFGYRTKNWKLMLARGSGGWTSPKEQQVDVGTTEAQLYKITDDIAESNDLYAAEPDTAMRLLGLLEADVQKGGSVPGQSSANDTDQIKLWKSGRGPASEKKIRASKKPKNAKKDRK